ncbi:MAG TPA: 2Fe-2S iron-sulfur cluster-binding protein [Spirochaetia bacterium]|nr:2Fe-2S iron-sulfur cluster-binding protein [Spirochaetia bacterium]
MSKRPSDEAPNRFTVSRRTFLKTVGVGAAATGLTIQAPRPAEAAILGPDPVPIPLKVNGATHIVTVEPRVTLLRALRNHLGLTGAKEVCERGACGGCTVLLDGEPICSCLMLAVDAVGHEITTVEGLGTPEKMSPVQAAFAECDAFQCGFCTPGFVVASTALLGKNPRPNLEEIKAGLSGNICRCGTYSRIFEAVQTAAKQRG